LQAFARQRAQLIVEFLGKLSPAAVTPSWLYRRRDIMMFFNIPAIQPRFIGLTA
jgi:hypothetical protein